MEAQPVLLSMAALSLTGVGFASLTIAIQHRDLDEWPVHLRIRLRTLIEAGLSNMVLALLPVTLFHLGVTEPTVWHWSSIVLAIAVTGVTLRVLVRAARPLRSGVMGTVFPVLATAIILVFALGNLANPLLSIAMPAAAGVYIAGLMSVLVYVAAVFLRLLTFSVNAAGDSDP